MCGSLGPSKKSVWKSV